MATYIITGNPISVMRPRNINQHCWDNLRQIKHKTINELEAQKTTEEPYLNPIHLELNFYFAPPGSHPPQHPQGYNHSRPDISDLIKFVENVATGILIKDANIIASISSFKRYSDMPRTEIIITELLNDPRKKDKND